MDKLMKKCRILITHGGVGSILTGINNNKKVIAVPRLAKYKEHGNDHQLQIVANFGKLGYIIPVNEMEDLEEAIKKSKNFKPKKFVSNTNKFIKLIEDYIDNL